MFRSPRGLTEVMEEAQMEKNVIRKGVESLHPALRTALQPESRLRVFEKQRILLLKGNNIEK